MIDAKIPVVLKNKTEIIKSLFYDESHFIATRISIFLIPWQESCMSHYYIHFFIIFICHATDVAAPPGPDQNT
jgi:hypothetical protein